MNEHLLNLIVLTALGSFAGTIFGHLILFFWPDFRDWLRGLRFHPKEWWIDLENKWLLWKWKRGQRDG